MRHYKTVFSKCTWIISYVSYLQLFVSITGWILCWQTLISKTDSQSVKNESHPSQKSFSWALFKTFPNATEHAGAERFGEQLRFLFLGGLNEKQKNS